MDAVVDRVAALSERGYNGRVDPNAIGAGGPAPPGTSFETRLRRSSGRGGGGGTPPNLFFRWPALPSVAPIGEGAEAGEAEKQHRPGRRFRRRGRAEGGVQFAVAARHSVVPDQIREGVIQGAAAPAALSAIAPGKGLSDYSERRFSRASGKPNLGGPRKCETADRTGRFSTLGKSVLAGAPLGDSPWLCPPAD